MSVVKVIEVMAQSGKGWEDAARQALAKASETVNNIQSIYIKEMKADVENNIITAYRIDAKISFIIE